MKYILSLLLITLSSSLFAQTITGVVTSKNEIVPNASIWVKGSFNETTTDDDGKFSIPAKEGDVIVASAFLFVPKEVSVGSSPSVTIDLAPDSVILDAIVLEKKKQERLIDAGFGAKRKDRVGYGVDIIDMRIITAADIDMFSVLRKVPGIWVRGFGLGQTAFFTRGLTINSALPQIIVDGTPTDQSILFNINPNMVESITLLRGLASNVKYGTLGVGGTILIRTKNSTDDFTTITKKPKALIEGNDYNEQPLLISLKEEQEKPLFLKELESATSFEDAKNTYQKYFGDGENTVAFYLESANYFSKWNQEYANSILYEIFVRANNNPKVLKAIAYTLQQKGNHNAVAFVCEELVELRPKDIQSYRDLAIAYVDAGRYELAATLYKQMLYNTIPNVDFTEIEDIVINEFRHLIANHKSEITYKYLPNSILANGFKKDVRLVLEWTDPLSQFDVQFVGPMKKFYTWEHTPFQSRKFIQNELNYGFSMKEFVIEESEVGEWIVNIQSLGSERKMIPTYLKYTLYRNYGLPNETKEVKLIDLSKFSDKVTLDTFGN